jgi:hypothetical protein
MPQKYFCALKYLYALNCLKIFLCLKKISMPKKRFLCFKKDYYASKKISMRQPFSPAQKISEELILYRAWQASSSGTGIEACCKCLQKSSRSNSNTDRNQEPILRLLYLYNYNASVVVHRARVIFKLEENYFDFKTHKATRGVVNIYNAGIVTRDRKIDYWIRYYEIV